jgi:hypothetical protein
MAGTYLTGVGVASQNIALLNTVTSGGRVFATLDFTDPSKGCCECQGSYLSIPEGWKLAENDAVSQSVITGNSWGTAVVFLGDGCGYVASDFYDYNYYMNYNSGLYYCTSLYVSGSTYKPPICDTRILIESLPKQSTPCLKCLAGTYSTAVGSGSNRTCVVCANQTFSEAAGASTCLACPTGTILNRNVGAYRGAGSSSKCFKFVSSASGISWDDAEAYCVGLGGHLASIDSADEQAFVTSLFPPGFQA